MKDDADIQQLFAAFKPEITDSQLFIRDLNKHLDAVDLTLKIQAIQKQNAPKTLWLAFAGGLMIGILIVALGLCCPSTYTTLFFPFEANQLLLCTSFLMSLLYWGILIGVSVWSLITFILLYQKATFHTQLNQLLQKGSTTVMPQCSVSTRDRSNH